LFSAPQPHLQLSSLVLVTPAKLFVLLVKFSDRLNSFIFIFVPWHYYYFLSLSNGACWESEASSAYTQSFDRMSIAAAYRTERRKNRAQLR